MKKIQTALSKIIAFILAVLFILVTVAVLLLFNTERHLLNSEVYKRALAKQNIYERFPTLIAEQLTYQMQSAGPAIEGEGEGSEGEAGGLPEQIKYLTQDDYETILRDLVPTDWLQTQTESALDQTFAFIDSEALTATITISLVEVKARIGGEAGVDAVLRLIHSWPPCTVSELADWDQVSTDDELGDLPTCRPPEKTLEAFTPEIKRTLSRQVAKMPDEADLTQTFKGDGEEDSENVSGSNSGDTPPNVRAFLKFARPLMRLSPLLSIVLLLLVTLFGVRSFKGWLRWWGIPFLVVGVLLGLPAVAALVGMNPVIANFMADKIPAMMTPSLFQVGVDLGRDILREAIQWIAIESGAIALIGLLLVVVSSLGPPRRRTRDNRRAEN